MSVFKCKMCGGTIEFEQGASVGVCDSCGTKQTLPKLADEKRATLYDRANHFRRNNEFDKAMSIYEQILNEDNTDAEAYWSLVLCRYGIEYVEDPATHKRVPTVNRTQFTSVFNDDNYRSALKYSDGYQKSLYEEEAEAINEIQKGILSISRQEESFDVFICYKETDNSGRRTPDSVLANDLYHQLTQEGFKVFFSRITLEDKLGSAYEPYIFAALNSAKVMVVLGTKPEYFDAVWVKNEWSRYLAFVKQSGGQKILIPAYKDMDPYDLPEEFSHLQAQDMTKLGFMQDLIRGIRKIVKSDKPKPFVKETIVASDGADISPLLKRAFIFLEDGNWQEVDQYCEKVLDRDPENSQAYLGKLMAELNIRKREDLINCDKNFDTNSNYQKVLRYGDEKLVQELKNCVADIDKRNRYNYAVERMNAAISEETYKAVSEAFGVLGDYKDSNILAKSCLEKVEECRKENIYHSASSIALVTAEACEKAQKLFESISGWKDSDEQISYCRTTAEKLRAKAEADRLERERKSELAKIKAKKLKKRIKKIAVIATPIVCVCIISVIILFTVIIPKIKYKNALEMLKNGHYDDAYALFEELGDTDKITESKRERADEMLENEQYDDAYTLFEEIGDEDTIAESKYSRANAFIDSNEYNQAYMLLNGLDYKDAQQIVKDFVFVPSKMVERSNTNGRITTEYSYDKNGNLTKEICSEVYYTYITEYIYDENGNLIKKIRSEIYDNISTIESSVEYSYDTSGKLVKESLLWSEGTTETEYTYNENGTLRETVWRQYDGTITTKYEYDEKGNILEEIASLEGLYGNSHTTTLYWYLNDKLLKKECKNSESDQGDSYTEYSYDQNGNLIEEFFLDWYGNQTSSQYSYDEVGNLKKIEKTDSHGNAYNVVSTIEYNDYQIFYRPE